KETMPEFPLHAEIEVHRIGRLQLVVDAVADRECVRIRLRKDALGGRLWVELAAEGDIVISRESGVRAGARVKWIGDRRGKSERARVIAAQDSLPEEIVEDPGSGADRGAAAAAEKELAQPAFS